ncbi:hypothetical protein BGZ98_000094, partial [Dissophora globulifera]
FFNGQYVSLPALNNTDSRRNLELPPLGNTIPGNNLELPLLGNTIPGRNLELPPLGNTFPGRNMGFPLLGNTIPGRNLKLPRPGNTVPRRNLELPPLGNTIPGRNLELPPLGNTIPRHNLELIPASIFAKDYHPQLFKGTPPKVDEDFSDTHQLAYCLAILQASPSPGDLIDEATRIWLHKTKTNEEEQERIKTMATNTLLEFMRDGLQDEKTTAEIACIAPLLDSSNFQSLIGIFVNSLKDSALLPIHTLEGLDRVIKYANPGSMDHNDLIKILEHVKLCLQTYTQSSSHTYRLMRSISHILDTMVDGNIKDLDHKKIHTSLLLYLERLKIKPDPYLAFQVAYTSQALLRILNEEKPWQTTLRHTWTAVKETANIFGTTKSFNVGQFINTIQGRSEVAVHIFEDFRYEMLRGIDALLQTGELTKVKTMICNAPCRHELDFQWGVCQRLGNLAADPIWDADSQEGAVAFLGEIYRNDAVWGQNTQVKRFILDILMQVSSTPGSLKSVKEFLSSNKKVLLLWGNSGTGKSTFCKELERKLWEDYSNCENRILKKQQKIPIFVALADIDMLEPDIIDMPTPDFTGLLALDFTGITKLETRHRPEPDLISRQLRKAGFSKAQIKALRASRKFVLICDGYDEYQRMRNLYNINQLNRPGQWNAQMVISCRSEYLGHDYRHLFQPENRDGQRGEMLLQEAVIAPFSNDRIQAYIEKYVAKEAPQWEVKDYMRVFDQISDVQDLVTNPSLLSLSLQELPHMTDFEKKSDRHQYHESHAV